jgi:hypothetical protein
MGIILNSKLRLTRQGVMQHYCLGCKQRHNISFEQPNESGACWIYNGNQDSPSFTPSIHIHYKVFNGTPEQEEEYERQIDAGVVITMPTRQYTQCHYFITDGNISYCGDSDHQYAGMTTPLADFPPDIY